MCPQCFLRLMIVVVVSLVGPCLTAADPVKRYTATDLGTLGRSNTAAFALNDCGQVVGASETSKGKAHAFLWERGQMRDLGTFRGDQSSSAFAINEKGQVVGESNIAAIRAGTFPGPGLGSGHAVIWDGGRIQELPLDTGSAVKGINDAGDIIGTIADEGTSEAFLIKNNKMIDLGSFGSHYSIATAINDDDVIGQSFTLRNKAGASLCRGFVWRKGRMRDLGISEVVGVNAINKAGTMIVGMADVPGSRRCEAFVWQNGHLRFLGWLPGSRDNSSADGVNNAGQIVGWSHTAQQDAQAVLWQEGKIFNLNQKTKLPHGWYLDNAKAINAAGWILCEGYIYRGPRRHGGYVIAEGGSIPFEVRHAFLLTPIAGPKAP